MKNFLIILCFSALLQACTGLISSSEKAAIVILNNTSNTTEIKALLNDNWTPPEHIKPGEASFLLLYESANNNEWPSYLKAILVTQETCWLELSQTDLLNIKTKDKDGRLGWIIELTPTLLKTMDCNHTFP